MLCYAIAETARVDETICVLQAFKCMNIAFWTFGYEISVVFLN